MTSSESASHWSINGVRGHDRTIEEFDMANDTCKFDGCDGKRSGRGYCRKHLYRLRTHGDPGVVITAKECAAVGEASPSWRGDDIGYSAAHFRVKKLRGRAALFDCVDCHDEAAEWAYIHGSIREQRNEKGQAYSADAEDYQPMCVPCHRAYDNDVTHCAEGHDYTEANTYWRPDGSRDCRLCRTERTRRHRQRRRLELRHA
jgi:hypothetical protein